MTGHTFDDFSPAKQAGILCNDEMFQRFTAERLGMTAGTCTTGFAAEYLRRHCGIKSRRDLNASSTAHSTFQALRTEFDAWRGKIPSQR